MTHWGWYWRVKKQYTAKELCSWFIAIDSFDMFKNKEGVERCQSNVIYEIPRFKLKAILLNNNYQVNYNNGSYSIPIEQQACNYGGVRYFFHCPKCNKRMRILYCQDGKFLCRKCLKLGYYTQRLRSSERCLFMLSKIKTKLKNMAGDLNSKPPWIKKKTFDALREKYFYYENQWEEKQIEEYIRWYCPNLKKMITPI